jgi:hypothetical protein
MEPEFITYQKFNDVELANELIAVLSENNIPYTMEEEAPVFDPSFSFKEIVTEYAVKINAGDFERVNQLLAESEKDNVNNADKDYYLFSFTNDELMEVITKADEWSAFDNQLARKIMADRGKSITDEQISRIKEERIEELKAPDAPQTSWIIIGYISAFLGGLIGIFIGWYLASYKKTLPDGQKVYGYTEHDRKQGQRIFFIGIVVFCIGIIMKVMAIYNS